MVLNLSCENFYNCERVWILTQSLKAAYDQIRCYHHYCHVVNWLGVNTYKKLIAINMTAPAQLIQNLQHDST